MADWVPPGRTFLTDAVDRTQAWLGANADLPLARSFLRSRLAAGEVVAHVLRADGIEAPIDPARWRGDDAQWMFEHGVEAQDIQQTLAAKGAGTLPHRIVVDTNSLDRALGNAGHHAAPGPAPTPDILSLAEALTFLAWGRSFTSMELRAADDLPGITGGSDVRRRFAEATGREYSTDGAKADLADAWRGLHARIAAGDIEAIGRQATKGKANLVLIDTKWFLESPPPLPLYLFDRLTIGAVNAKAVTRAWEDVRFRRAAIVAPRKGAATSPDRPRIGVVARRTGPQPGQSSPKRDLCERAIELLNSGQVTAGRGSVAELARALEDEGRLGGRSAQTAEKYIRATVRNWESAHSPRPQNSESGKASGK